MRLIVDNLACSRGGRRLFDAVSFAIAPGEALLVTGENGAGKSTLIAAIAGRLTPDSGSIRAEETGERTLIESTHVVGHRDGLKASLSAAENLAFATAISGEPRLSPQEALAAVGLAHAADLPAGYLSAGQRRRVALARLLVAHRPLWLLDEPTAALDLGSQKRLLGLMQDHLDEGGLILAATHQPLPVAGAREIVIARRADLHEPGFWEPDPWDADSSDAEEDGPQ